MTAPTEESKEQELNLSDIIHTFSPSPAPRSQFQSTPQTPIQNTPSSVPVLTLVCKRTNQPLTPPIRMHGLSNSPETSATNATSELAPEVTPPSPPPQLHQDLDGIPQLSYRSGISPLSSSISPLPPSLPPAFPLSDLQQAHATITHLAQQLTLLRHQRDLLTHQRDIFIAQKEEEREKHEAEKAAWERLAEALIAQNAKETTAGVGRKAVEMAEKYALRVEDENRSLRQKLLDATTRLSTLEKELDRLRPLLLMSVAATSHRTHSIASDTGAVTSIDALGSSRNHGHREVPVSLARRSSEASSVSVPHPVITKKRRKAKSAGTSQSLIPAPVRASHHKGSPLSDDARAECMLSAAKTVGRRRLDAMMQKGLRGIWALQQDRRDGQSGETETSEEVADIPRQGRHTPTQPREGERRPPPNSLLSQGDSSMQPESGSRSLSSPIRKSKAIPIIPIPTSGNGHSLARPGDVTSTSTGSNPERVTQSFVSAIAAPPSQAAPSSTPAQEQQPRRRGRPKGAKNKKRASQVQATDDEADADTSAQPSQGFRSLLSAAMTLEGGDRERAEGGGEEGISQEELSGVRRTRRQTTRAQVVVELKPRRRSRPKDASAAETSPPSKRRKVATTASSVPYSQLPPQQQASPPPARASPSSEHAGPSIISRSTPSRTLDGVSRMRSALDVLADQAIQEVRRPSLTSKADERSLQASLPLPVGLSSRPGSAELVLGASASNPPISIGPTNRSADDVSGVPMDAVEQSEDELMYPPTSFTDTTFFAPRSPVPAIQPVGEGNQHSLNPQDAGLYFVTRNSPTPHFAVVTRDSQIESRSRPRSKSLSDRDASGEPEDPEEVDMAMVHDSTSARDGE